MSVRQTEALVAKKIAARGAPPAPKRKSLDLSDMERRVSDAIGYRVSITTNRKGGGDVSISFSDLYQLDDIVDRLTRESGTPAVALQS
jgi:ParB family chromosome partitioning protein